MVEGQKHEGNARVTEKIPNARQRITEKPQHFDSNDNWTKFVKQAFSEGDRSEQN